MDCARRKRTPMGNYRSRKLGIYVSVVVLAVLIGCTLLAYAAFASSITEHRTLQQVVFVFRHGDRNPAQTYPKDPYINYTWPGGLGALTKKGMRQLYNVGQWIRQEYGSFIGDKFDSAITLVRSSYADRCIMSGQTLLAGLFPPSTEDMFLPGLAWTPIPVHMIPRNLDKVVVVAAPCPRLKEALKEAYSREAESSDEKVTRYYKELAEHTGLNITTITDVEFLYNTLAIEDQHGLQLPKWTQKFYNDEMRKIAARSLAIFTDGTTQKRLRGGPLVKEILTHMEEAVTNSKPKRTYLYSAHDTTIVNTIRTIGLIADPFLPDYGAMLIFELHRTDGGIDSEVKILYLDSWKTKTVHPLTIPGCASPCLLKTLRKVLYQVIPNDWDEECKI